MIFTSLINELKNDRPESEGYPDRPNGSDKDDIALFYRYYGKCGVGCQ